MDDLGIITEHMGRLYLWRVSKLSHRVHILDPRTERAHCQAENCRAGKPFDGRGEEIPAGRRLCGNCIDLAGRDKADYREQDIRVLMGERLAETEPDLFTGIITSELEPERTDLTSFHDGTKWKRAKQGRRAHRSKWGRPKRSTTKYPRPFDDDLPSW